MQKHNHRPPRQRGPFLPPEKLDPAEVFLDENFTEEDWRNDIGQTGRNPSLDDYDRWDK